MPQHGDNRDAPPEGVAIDLGTPHGAAVGCLRMVIAVAGLFCVGMMVYGASGGQPGGGALVVFGTLGLGAVAVGWIVLRKAAPSKLIVSTTGVTLHLPSAGARQVDYAEIKAVEVQSRSLVHRFGKTKSREEVQLLVFRLRGGDRIEVPASDEIAIQEAIQVIRTNLAGRPRADVGI